MSKSRRQSIRSKTPGYRGDDVRFRRLAASIQFALILTFCAMLTGWWGCTAVKNLGALDHREANCYAKPGQIGFVDARTGWPLLSAPHRASCEVDNKGAITWRDEDTNVAAGLGGDLTEQAISHFNWGIGF